MAKKKAPQRLPGAEESCISPEQEAIIQWFRTVKFRKNLLGGVDEAAMWKKLEELYALYEAAIRAERTRYNVLLEQQTGSVLVNNLLEPGNQEARYEFHLASHLALKNLIYVYRFLY